MLGSIAYLLKTKNQIVVSLYSAICCVVCSGEGKREHLFEITKLREAHKKIIIEDYVILCHNSLGLRNSIKIQSSTYYIYQTVQLICKTQYDNRQYYKMTSINFLCILNSPQKLTTIFFAKQRRR